MKENDQFQEVGVIGEGAFGKVIKAVDKNKRFVAIKYIKFEGEDEGVPATALREISLLKTLKSHPNIVPLIDVSYQPKEQILKIIFDFFDFDLKKFMTSKQYKPNQELIKIILKKILNGVAYIHSKKIMHRDLKPQNILIDHQHNVKIADFGLARLLMVPKKTLTHQIETLWYRAPEVLLGQPNYTYAVDVWAVGCIFIELFTRRPFFLGNGYQIQQIFQIFSVMGTPTLMTWPSIDKLPDFKPSFPKWKKKSLINLLPMISESGIDLLEKLIDLNPMTRITAKDALEHQYIRDIEIS